MAFSPVAIFAGALGVAVAVAVSLRQMLRKNPRAIWPIAAVVTTILILAGAIAFAP
jgi:hypothetical protein